ncbi:MAG: three-Cys-motif partner protein TcmP [Trichormus sp. ATA11-4-KO1]|jgi:three-Cys-motif partner protein|nr:three-Cys-motif partner protein TcmP [Trichormus sp. ATA11-4-KO1]
MSGKQLSLFDQQPEDSNKFFTRKRPWSAAKHRIMLRYIQAHCYNLGGSKPYQSMYINYVDGFAGAGKYDEGIGIENFVDNSNFWQRYKTDFLDTDGSPLIALKCAKIFRIEERVNLRCFFTEENQDLNQKLKSNCSLVGEGLPYKIYEPQRFDKVLTQIMYELDEYPTLFFLDAFGVKGVTFEQICSIADYVSKYKGELFLLFHNRAVARNAGFYKINYKNSKEQKTAETYTYNLTKLLGSNSDLDWKAKWLECQNQEQKQKFERWALEYFKSRLQKESSFKGVATFEVKETYNDSRPQYNIVVGSNHPQKAFGEFLNEFFCQENKLLFFEDDKSSNNNKFLSQVWERENNERVSIIKPKIIDILRKKNQDWMILHDVITLIILEVTQLGYLSRTKYREILLELHQQKIIEARELGKRGNLTLKNYVRVVR